MCPTDKGRDNYRNWVVGTDNNIMRDLGKPSRRYLAKTSGLPRCCGNWTAHAGRSYHTMSSLSRSTCGLSTHNHQLLLCVVFAAVVFCRLPYHVLPLHSGDEKSSAHDVPWARLQSLRPALSRRFRDGADSWRRPTKRRKCSRQLLKRHCLGSPEALPALLACARNSPC